MKQHELRPPHGSRKKRKRVGRGTGSGRGKTAGRGMMGQRARSGHGIRPTFEGGQRPLVQRLPMKRGFTNIFRIEYSVINVGRLAEVFAPGETITPLLLKQRRVIRNLNRPIKILGEGELDRPLHIYVHGFSSSAQEKIEAAGGSCTVLDPQLLEYDHPADAELAEVVD
ncbi:MAG: 50S ribosomal protein L15 [Chloroflexia bacterium]|nr:50S ribosomal protein L15 [Chloroflexia bacterium]